MAVRETRFGRHRRLGSTGSEEEEEAGLVEEEPHLKGQGSGFALHAVHRSATRARDASNFCGLNGKTVFVVVLVATLWISSLVLVRFKSATFVVWELHNHINELYYNI